MHYSTIIAILSASSVLAAPAPWKPNNYETQNVNYDSQNTHNNPVPQGGNQHSEDKKPQITVELADPAAELATQTRFTAGIREHKRPSGSSGPFKTISIKLDDNVQNKELRCMVLSKKGRPIVAKRGENTDITFSDGGKGPWTFKHPSKVAKIICDPKFKKGMSVKPMPQKPGQPSPPGGSTPSSMPSSPPSQLPSDVPSEPASQPSSPPSSSPSAAPGTNAEPITIQLSNNAKELATQTRFTEGSRQEKTPVGSSGPFTSVTLTLDKAVKNQDLRCQILDNANKPITLKRGENTDVTFSDGGKGAWEFLEPKESMVGKIVCDPAFKKGGAGSTPTTPQQSSQQKASPQQSSSVY